MKELNYKQVEETLITWLREKVKNAGCSGAVVGLSGGIDSAVTAVLCKKAFDSNFLGIIMPCYSSEQDAEDAELLAREFKINYITRDLSTAYDQLIQTFEPENQEQSNINTEEKTNMAKANIKPRLRMITLYYYAASHSYLVVGTDNWSELTVGYFTKHGDGGIDLAPLGRLVKTEVKELARHLGIPKKIINKKPSAGLWEGQTDEEELGIPYKKVDQYILTGKADKRVKERIDELAENNAHKTEPIPIPERDILL